MLSTLWKEMGIAEEEGGLTVFDTDISAVLPTAERTTWLTDKISAHILATEGLREQVSPHS